MSDYNFRGISQSDRGPSVTAYVETRYNVNPSLQLYAGSQYWAVDLPTNPSCECDFYAGFRPTVGPLAFDFGFIYYWYPRNGRHVRAIPAAPFPTYPNGTAHARQHRLLRSLRQGHLGSHQGQARVRRQLLLFAGLAGTGAYGFYASGTAKVTMPSFNVPTLVGPKEIGWYISGEVGHYSLGTTDSVPGVAPAVNLPDYWTWNVGVAFTQGVFTVDFRYYDTDRRKAECFALTSDPRGAFVAAIAPGTRSGAARPSSSATKFDLTVLTNLK